MPNGRPGDDPINDMFVHGKHPFPSDMEAMLREVFAIDREFPDGKRPFAEGCRWEQRFFDWAQGKNLDEGRQVLKAVLQELKGSKG